MRLNYALRENFEQQQQKCALTKWNREIKCCIFISRTNIQTKKEIMNSKKKNMSKEISLFLV